MKRFFWLMLLLTLPLFASASDLSFPITPIQRAIVSQSVWLNTSRPFKAEDLAGRIVLLDFWTLGCINCMDIIPDLKSLEQEFGSSLTVIGVHSAKFSGEKDTDDIRNAILRYGLMHPVINDADFAIWNSFGVHAWPTLILITPDGKVASTYAGEGNRAALEADIKTLEATYKGKFVMTPLPLALESSKQPATSLRFPGKLIAFDKDHLLVADSGHNRIVISDLHGTISQTIGSGAEGFKDGSFAEAQFYKPQGMAYKDGLLYVADLGNHALRLVDFKARKVSTLAGTGKQGHFLESMDVQAAARTPLSSPWDVTFFPDDAHLAIAMTGAQQLWSYDIANHTLTLLAGNGQEAIDDGRLPYNSLAQPSGLFASGDKLYFTDAETSSLRVLDGKDGTVTTLIGKGLFDFGYKEGTQSDALMQHCLGLTGYGDSLYIADTYNHSIRRYDLKDVTLHNFTGQDKRGAEDGTAQNASFNEPGGIAQMNGVLYIADTNNHLIRAVDVKSGTVSTLGKVASVPRNFSGPNLMKLSFSLAADSPVDITLDLKPGWHINDEAPSELDIMTDAGKTAFPREQLKSRHITLPKLKSGATYHLTGTIYYCADKAGSLCMIKSFDAALTPGGKDKIFSLPVY